MEADVFEMQSQVDVEPEQQSPIVEATKRGRGGKTVTVIKGLQLRGESLEALCKSLKVKMGSGGAVKDGEIEIQVCFEIASHVRSFLKLWRRVHSAPCLKVRIAFVHLRIISSFTDMFCLSCCLG